MDKIDLFCSICNINKRLKSHYKAKFNKIDNNQFDEKRNSVLFIYQILDELQNQKINYDRLNTTKRSESRKKDKHRIESLERQLKNYKDNEDDFRKILNTFRRYIIENEGDSVYEELVDTELQEINKSYYGI